jgi:hypothetical protein
MKVVENEIQFNDFLKDLKKMDPDAFLSTISRCQHCEDVVDFCERLMNHFEGGSMKRHFLKLAIEMFSKRK